MEATMKYQMIVLVSAALASASALAEEPNSAKGTTDLFKTVDADADGKISKDEAAANASFAKNFSAMDKNSDGFVSEDEYRKNTRHKPDRQY
jgi:Ca2+-binding EF-hand superfamily protein